MALSREASRVVRLVEMEYDRAVATHRPFASVHEGYAVMLEEVDELWTEVKRRAEARSGARIEDEAVQVAAMAVRIAVEFGRSRP